SLICEVGHVIGVRRQETESPSGQVGVVLTGKGRSSICRYEPSVVIFRRNDGERIWCGNHHDDGVTCCREAISDNGIAAASIIDYSDLYTVVGCNGCRIWPLGRAAYIPYICCPSGAASHFVLDQATDRAEVTSTSAER
ncbi:MAG TPA: hypothetical protein VFL92_03990, partial [Sphingomonas sp.]|nr:hypothetical protein [Sphingomonas sp.]